MQTSDFDYELPPELIAQEPLQQRDAARMMVLDRGAGRIEHRHVADLTDVLHAGDLLVVNDTRVFPARLFGHCRDTGGRVELLLLEEVDRDSATQGRWEAFFRGRTRARPGLVLDLAQQHIRATILSRNAGGRVTVELACDGALMDAVERYGMAPVPPYIKRARSVADDDRLTMDRERYQTVYARDVGAVAAPTAGLHFTDDLLQRLAAHGVGRAAVTLHVGPGTFRPVKADRVEDHVMDAERFRIGPETAARVRATRSAGGRVVAVGSTTVRTLETVAARHAEVIACEGRSELFIRPPYDFKVTDAMLTNFHLPRSSLLMMISALAGRDVVLNAYREAIRHAYRFYSYGDCMLIL